MIVAGSPPGIPGSTNAMRVHTMGDAVDGKAPAYRSRPRSSRPQDFGPTCRSSTATASRRATETWTALGRVHLTPSRSRAHVHRPMMSSDRLLKK